MKIILSIFLSCTLLFNVYATAQNFPWHQLQESDSSVLGTFNVIKHEYTLSTEFELEWEGAQYARALKSCLHLRSHYDVYDTEGEFTCKGVGSWIPSFGLGWMYTWAADFSVYDKQGMYLGSFKGTLYTDAVAKFIFYDADMKRIGVAYMDKERTSFSLHSPTNFTKKILEVQRQVVPYKTDYWTLAIYDDNIIPPELVQVFAIFTCDRQNDFDLK